MFFSARPCESQYSALQYATNPYLLTIHYHAFNLSRCHVNDTVQTALLSNREINRSGWQHCCFNAGF